VAKLKYPYQNLFLKSIRGETWEDIPRLLDHYQVSNYGRIKRLEYEMLYKNGAIYLKPEKVITPSVVKQFNKFKNDYSYFLTNRVKFKNERPGFSIPGLVYYSFMEKFDIEDHSIVKTRH
jgi:NUMOD4 motif